MAPTPPRRGSRPPTFGRDWVNFVSGSQWVLGGLPQERFLDQFEEARNRLLQAAVDPRVISALDQAAKQLGRSEDGADALELLQLELRAYKAAADMAAKETQTTEGSAHAARSRLASIGSTMIDSLVDVFEDLIRKNPYVYAAIKGLGEILSFHSGK